MASLLARKKGLLVGARTRRVDDREIEEQLERDRHQQVKASELEWKGLMNEQEVAQRQHDELRKIRREAADYAGVSDESGDEKKDQKAEVKGGGGDSSGSDEDAESKRAGKKPEKKPEKKPPIEKERKLNIKGGQLEARRSKKEKKKEEKRKAKDAHKEAKKQKANNEDPDRYQKLQVQGEQAARSIDTRRLCKYVDHDAPVDLASQFEGRFREKQMADYSDL